MKDRREKALTYSSGIDAYKERRRYGSDWLQKGFVGDRRSGKDRRNN